MDKKPRKDLLISSGKIEDDNLRWDIDFWQGVSFLERANITIRMSEDVYRLKFNFKPVDARLNRTFVSTGKISHKNE